MHPEFKLDPTSSMEHMQAVEERSNIIGLLEALFPTNTVEKNVLICDNKVKANLLVDKKYAIQVHENI